MKHTGGSKVGKGTYWNFSTGERVDISHEGILPGDRSTVYYKLPASGILVFGPVLGLLYAIFLPFIGIAMALKLLAQKIGTTLAPSARTSATFGWRPSESYLAGKKRAKKEEKVERKEEQGSKEEEKH